MPITEFVFINPKPDAETRQHLDAERPALLTQLFSQAANLNFAHSAKTLQVTGKDVASRDREVLVIQWEEVSAFDAFVTSPAFASFKSSLMPFMAGPPDLQLYEASDGASIQKVIETTSYLHVVKAYANAEDAEEPAIRRSNIVRQWEALTDAMGEASRTMDSSPSSYNALGLRQQEGVFLAVTGWQDHDLLQTVLSDARVKEQLLRLQDATGVDLLSTFVFETKKVSFSAV